MRTLIYVIVNFAGWLLWDLVHVQEHFEGVDNYGYQLRHAFWSIPKGINFSGEKKYS